MIRILVRIRIQIRVCTFSVRIRNTVSYRTISVLSSELLPILYFIFFSLFPFPFEDFPQVPGSRLHSLNHSRPGAGDLAHE
jgi:hypothetical protein